jgi:hypothetical protein
LAENFVVRARSEPPHCRRVDVDFDAWDSMLGRISLVRKGGADARRNEQLARLLAFF